jgi:hypothetical protein
MRAFPKIAEATGLAMRLVTIEFTSALAFCSRIVGQFSPKLLRARENGCPL